MSGVAHPLQGRGVLCNVGRRLCRVGGGPHVGLWEAWDQWPPSLNRTCPVDGALGHCAARSGALPYWRDIDDQMIALSDTFREKNVGTRMAEFDHTQHGYEPYKHLQRLDTITHSYKRPRTVTNGHERSRTVTMVTHSQEGVGSEHGRQPQNSGIGGRYQWLGYQGQAVSRCLGPGCSPAGSACPRRATA